MMIMPTGNLVREFRVEGKMRRALSTDQLVVSQFVNIIVLLNE